jgi:hypothetical protein
MTTLHLGVLDVPYARAKGKTTGDVAEILEARYGIMRAFWQRNRQAYLDALVGGSVEDLEARLQGRSARANPKSTLEKMRHDFRVFISQRQVEQVGLKGVPTEAALKGVSHRLKHPYAKRNPRRPSFRDTGLYEASFRAWID